MTKSDSKDHLLRTQLRNETKHLLSIASTDSIEVVSVYRSATPISRIPGHVSIEDVEDEGSFMT